MHNSRRTLSGPRLLTALGHEQKISSWPDIIWGMTMTGILKQSELAAGVRRACVAVLLAAAASAISLGPARAVVVNINSKVNGAKSDGFPSVNVFLSAGTYNVTPISLPPPGFTAWNAWNDGTTSGCDANGVCSNTGWLNLYMLSDNGSGDVPEITIWDGLKYQTAALAFAHALSFQFTLTTAQTISFYISDNNLIDNVGGISLDVSAVPLPAALPLFATGLGALGLLGWRRKRKAKLAV